MSPPCAGCTPGYDELLERAFGAFTTPDQLFDLNLPNEVLQVTQREGNRERFGGNDGRASNEHRVGGQRAPTR